MQNEATSAADGAISRRSFIAKTAAAGTLALLAPSLLGANPAPAPYQLPPLPYATDALAPYIDAETMRIHHTLHHGGYVKNLNTALEAAGSQWAKLELPQLLAALPDVPAAQRTAIQNNGGGHWNHSFFWESMKPGGSQLPAGLKSTLEKSFGSADDFKIKFAQAATGRFGSGWAWLVKTPEGKLAILSTPNQNNPLMAGTEAVAGTPLLGLDVWEHAYYLLYQNRRADYINAWWNVVNWDAAAARLG